MRSLAAVAALSIAIAACAGGTGSGGSSSAQRNVLTAEDLATTGLTNALEAIERARPEWLRSRGATSFQHGTAEWVVVYVDQARYGEMSTLRNVRLTEVREIRYLSGPEATHRYGTGHAGGVIHVMLK